MSKTIKEQRESILAKADEAAELMNKLNEIFLELRASSYSSDSSSWYDSLPERFPQIQPLFEEAVGGSFYSFKRELGTAILSLIAEEED
jgi:hypothetical protein